MKIILSRKGFDSTWGGYPSPILPDGRLVSLPIPSDDSIRYSDIKIDANKTYYDRMIELNQNISDGKKWVPLTHEAGCHLDPDINSLTKQRGVFWKPIFGQSGRAQGYLDKQGIKDDDLFLFFGTFRETIVYDVKLQFDPKEKGRHVIFGYLQVGKIIKSQEDVEGWMMYHSHCDSKRVWRNNNTVYLARKKLSWNATLQGAGVFKFNKSLVLTAEGRTKRFWNLPDFFRGKISHQEKNCWEGSLFKSASIGQEFVSQEDSKIEGWAKELIEKNSRWSM